VGLLQNGFRHKLTGRTFGATNIDGANASVLVYNRNQAAQNRDTLTGYTTAQASVPSGTRHPEAWIMPRSPGGLSARMYVIDGRAAGTAWAVALRTASLTGSGDLAALGGLVVNLLADLVGSGEISAADLKAFLQAAANLSGSGDLAATAGGLGELLADIEGSGTAEGALLTAIGALVADIVVTGTGLTVSNVGPAVWSAIAAANNDPGTMGEKLNDAGSASNPWTEVLEAGLSAGDFMRLMMAVLQGNATGLEDGAIVYKGLDGTTTRIEATYVDGVRTITLRNGS
jgi:hypothetical protein